MWTRLLCLFALWLWPEVAIAEDSPGLPSEVSALLRQRCGKCHGGRAPKARLDLTSAPGITRGGRKGPVVVPGKPEASRLWEMVSSDRMPPKSPLAEPERRAMREWIEAGAPGLDRNPSAAHWAFRPPARPPLPDVAHAGPARTPVDRFILAALDEQRLALSPEADWETLLRRLCFDLTGLPPTPAEIDTFRDDPRADAYERMVERYLASPHYGERWGKYWLDAAGYADSNGYFSADSDRPLAWKYRDYVLRAFNADLPYDRFVREQLAGDELAGFRPDADVTPALCEPLTATHFLRNAPDGTGESDGNPDEVRTDRFTVLEGNLQITMNCLLGLTIQCARCHDHKFEPIGQQEYYRLQAILYPAYCPDRWTNPNDRTLAVATRAQRDEFRRRTDRVERQVKALQASLTTVAAPLREQLLEERLQHLDVKLRDRVLQAAALPQDKLSADQKALVKQHVAPLKLGDDEVAKRFPEFAGLREQVRKAVAEREKERPKPLEKVAVLTETDPNPPPHHVLVRGKHNAPGPEVQPGVPAALCTPANGYRLAPRPAGQASSGRRSAFARWVTSPENPLFARVMVNRVWQHHFGTGLVATPDNLGQSGARPSHPELLDWLAVEFVESGYSVKHLHRLILHSAAYRQASTPRPEVLAVDPDNRLLSHYPLRRLDAEALRDALLATSGELDRRFGGPFVPTQRAAEGTVEVNDSRSDAHRRSVYLQQRRTQVATLLELFDAPSIAANCSLRNTSTIPLQALTLMNSDFVRRRAAAFARRLEREAGPDAAGRLRLAFRLASGRVPGPAEQAAAERFLAAQRAVYAPEKDAEQRVWTDFCQMLVSSNVCLYVE
jgi:Protein of unknown function (DUF1553)/Protein of unknown function (DUF1549)/Planctomycete cytochrome C